jgi:hypothetical protein
MSQFSQYTPPRPASCALVAHQIVVAAPCSTVLKLPIRRARSTTSFSS